MAECRTVPASTVGRAAPRWRSVVAVMTASVLAAALCMVGSIPRGPAAAAEPEHTVTYDHYSMKIDGHRVFVYAGEFDPFRLPSPSLWRDVLQKMKAAGFNTVTSYFDWDYHSAAPGHYDFGGVRDVDEYLSIAKQVGIYVIARPGPYINAETDSGGFPGWLTTIKGKARSTAPDYMAAAKQWLRKVDPIIERYQLTNGGGTVIGDQIENEYYNNDPDGRSYMSALEKQARSDGITVPFIGNHNAAFASGAGAVDLPGYDEYPQGFDCTNPSSWHGVPTGLQAKHDTLPKDKPLIFPEFQGGAFDPWGGPGYANCRKLTNSDFERVFYSSLVGQGVSLLNLYMTEGATNWGFEPEPGVYTSYDYGAAIDEARQLTGKYSEQKRIAYLVTSVPALAHTDPVNDAPAPDNPAIHQDTRRDPASGATLYVLRHADSTSTADDTTHIAVDTHDGSYSRVPQQGSIRLNGRDAKMLLADTDAAGAHLVYSTSELMTATSSRHAGTLLLHGRAGQDGETVLRYRTRPHVRVLAGKVSTHWDSGRGDLRLDYSHHGLARVKITSGGHTLRLLIADEATSAGFWREHTSAGTFLVRGPHLVRTAAAHGSTLALTGDTSAPGRLEVFAPDGAHTTALTWNGRRLHASRTRYGTLSAQLAGPPKASVPKLSGWRFQRGAPERQPGFDDSHWTRADHTRTNNPNPPGSKPVLYADDYGFHHGDVWYRGHFTGGAQTGVTLDGEGGTAGMYSVWLNGHFLGTQPSGSHTFTFPKGALRPGHDNVLSALVMNMGHDEDWSANDSYKAPRGIRTATFTGAATGVQWRIQGDNGGEHPVETARGPLNNGGLYGERHGWYLPGYPDGGWRRVSLPDRWPGKQAAGVGWYRTTFTTHLPHGTDVPLGLTINDSPKRHYRALIYLNGWLMGIYANDVGPQHVFSLPPGVLRADGRNTLAIAVWGEDAASGGLGSVSLHRYGDYASDLRVRDVASPGWNERTWGAPTVPAIASQVTGGPGPAAAPPPLGTIRRGPTSPTRLPARHR